MGVTASPVHAPLRKTKGAVMSEVSGQVSIAGSALFEVEY